jgi:hypothetical protein
VEFRELSRHDCLVQLDLWLLLERARIEHKRRCA